MATKIKNDSAQTGVEVSTTGSAGATGAETSGNSTSGNAPVGTENSNFGGGAIETNETAGAQTATEAGNAPESETGTGTAGGTENAPEGEGTAQNEGETEAAPVSMEDLTRKPKNLSEVPIGERPLAQHSEEVKVRNEAAQATGGEETVAAGIHKGRKIVNGVIDFSTASDREKTIAANKKTAKENLATEAEPAGEEKKAA